MDVPARLINTALMVAPDRVNEIIGAITNTAGVMFFAKNDQITPTYERIDRVGVVHVTGGLVYRGYGWDWNTSYLDIRKAFQEALADRQAESILLDIDSPGGEVAGVFDLADEIYSARGIKPIVAIANESAFSAAYAIASSADEVYLSRTARVGSVGVIAVHVDQSGYNSNLGIKVSAIYAGARKNDCSPHQPLSDPARESIQLHIDRVYDLFTATVARNRRMDQDAVKQTEAGIYAGDEAVRIGLADGVKTFEQVFNGLIKLQKGNFLMGIEQIKEAMQAEKPEDITALATELGFVPASAMPDVEKIKADAFTAGQIEGAKQAAMAAAEIVELCQLSGTLGLAVGILNSGANLQDAKKAILDEKAKQASQQNINSTVGPLTTGEVNPLIEDAKRRAQGHK